MARFIFVAILLAAGAMSFWGAQTGELDSRLFGWFYLAGGVLFLSYRNYIEIDVARQRLSHRTGFVYAFVRSGYDTESITRMTLTTFRVVRKKGKSSTNYRLLVNGSKSKRLCDHEDPWISRLVAERVCRVLRVEFDNQRFGVPSVRTAQELDLPLAERWREKDEVKAAPVFDSSSTFELSADGGGATLSRPNTPAPFPKIFLVVIPFVALMFWLGSTGPLMAIGAVLVGGLWLAFPIGIVLSHAGPIVLRVTPTAVVYRHGKMPFRTLPIADIEELIDEDQGLHLLSDRNVLTLNHPADPRDRQLQRQFLEYQIAMRQPALIAGLRQAV